jgi:hypothetical protein
LHFAEIFFWSIGNRVFDIQVENGQAVVSDVDIVSEGGLRSAVIKTVENLHVKDGSLDLDFEALLNNGKISAIEVILMSTDT